MSSMNVIDLKQLGNTFKMFKEDQEPIINKGEELLQNQISSNLDREEFMAMKSYDFKGDGWFKDKPPMTSKHPEYSQEVRQCIKEVQVIIPYENVS